MERSELEARLEVLRREEPAQAATSERRSDLTSAVIQVVISAPVPVSAKEVSTELRAMGMEFAENGISTLLGRDACEATAIDDTSPLRKAGRGLYARNTGEPAGGRLAP